MTQKNCCALVTTGSTRSHAGPLQDPSLLQHGFPSSNTPRFEMIAFGSLCNPSRAAEVQLHDWHLTDTHLIAQLFQTREPKLLWILLWVVRIAPKYPQDHLFFSFFLSFFFFFEIKFFNILVKIYNPQFSKQLHTACTVSKHAYIE